MTDALERAARQDLAAAPRARLAQLQTAWTASREAIATARAEAVLAGDAALDARDVAAGERAAADAPEDGAKAGFYLRAGAWAERSAQRVLLKSLLAPEAARSDGGAAALTAKTLWAARGANLWGDGALAAPAGAGPRGWIFGWRDAQFLHFGPAAAPGPSGGAAFAVAGSDMAILWREAPVVAGQLYEVSFAWRGRLETGAWVHWIVAYYDAAGKFLASPWRAAAPPGAQRDWLREGAVTRAPPGAAKLRLLFYFSRQEADDTVELAETQARPVQWNEPSSAAADVP